MVVVLKNSVRTPPIYLPCMQLEQRKMSHFSFSLSHTLTVFLSIFGLHLSAEALSFVLLAHSGTHTKMAELPVLQLSVLL